MKDLVGSTRDLLLALVIVITAIACSPQTPSPPPPAPVAASAVANPESLVSDSNEPPEATRQYQEARESMAAGKMAEARILLEKAVAQFPESRHLHQVYADVLWHESKGTDPELLRQSADEAVRAAEIGLRSATVDYTLTSRLAETLGRTGDRERLDRIFKELLAKDPSSTVYLDYGAGLALLGEGSRAEDAFRQALRSDPNGDAAARYGEWLLDRKRDEEALDILPLESPVYYIHFLRGVALERLGRTSEAHEAYGRYRDYSRTHPAPSRFRISGSTVQSGIRFEDRS